MKRIVLAVAATLLLNAPAIAQSFPTRPVTLVVSSEAGGPVDFPARAIRDELSVALGQPIVIENRSGAGGMVGAAAVARATPDGYTILFSSPGPFVIAPHLYSNMGYDSLKDFEPVSLVADVPALFATSIGIPAKTLGEFVALAKKEPGKLNYGTGGIATPSHLGPEMLKALAGIDIVHVPFRGAPQAMTALLINEIALFVSSPAVAISHEAAGKIRILAVTGSQRMKRAPHIPTATEAGMPELTVPAWYGIYAPKGTPKPIIDILDAAIKKALDNKQVRERLEASSYVPIGEGPGVLADFMKKDYDRWGDVIKKAGIKVK